MILYRQLIKSYKYPENIIKPSKIASGNDSRVRGLSNVSEISNVSVASESEEILFKRDGPREQGWPVRQPEDPPDSPLAQIHAGFRKFLKEHSSPPYSRVTAGGRIVPASPPATSPTYFNLGAIDNVIHGQANVTAAINPVLPGPPRNVEDQVRSNAVAASDTSYMAAASGGSQADSRLSSASFVTALPRTGFSQIQANMAIPHQIPTFPTPLPAGSRILMITLQGAAIVVVNNMLYEATSVGPNTILAPLQVLKPNPQLAPIPMYPAHGTIPPVPMIPMQTMPLVNMTNNVPVAFSHPSRDSLQRQHDELRVQLEQLDKHVALHRSELGSQALAALVARRVQLVVKLDKTRVAKEQLVKTAPVPLRPSGEQPKEGRQQFGFGNGLASQYVSGAGLPAVSGGPRIHSAFFPPHPSGPNYDVPTLVPAAYRGDTNGWRMNGNTHNIETSTWQTNGSQAPQVRLNNNNSSVSQYESPGGGRKNSAQRPRKNTLNAEAPVWEYGSTNVPQGSIVSAGHCSPSSNAGSGPSWAHGSAPPPNEMLPQGHNIEQIGVERGLPIYGVVNRQPFDIPLVTEEQASYATMLDLNPRVGPKKYCTTPAEFAEVIRQAREQATLFGRLGHSINDPQWDAEKDVRWAMEDDEPVPLPNVVPKYFSDPRPWSWPSKAYGDETAHLTFDSKTGWGEPVNGGQGIYKMDETTGFRPGYDSPAWTRPSFQKLPRIVHGPGGSHTYAHQNTTSGNYPPKPVFSQATWIENDNGNITKRTNHAYVEDAPNTPSRHGSETRSVTVRAVSGQTHGTVPLAWELPSLDECKGKAKAKDSWATNSQDEYVSSM